MPKVLIVGQGVMFQEMFERHGWEVVDSFDDAEFLQFTGGSDVNPVFYGEAVHPRTFYDTRRDEEEAAIYQKALAAGKVMLGVCRGGQFLNVMNGGSLYQHVENHAIRGTHLCQSSVLGKRVRVTSTHHQMMIPTMDAFVEGWSWNMSPYKEHMNANNRVEIVTTDQMEAEVVWYEDTKSLCFQPHPEYYGAASTESYYFEVIGHFTEV
tara:strand:- start:22559 stop:23185 length:627 start_codon:yes stop_codon:yes gene_type:complete